MKKTINFSKAISDFVYIQDKVPKVFLQRSKPFGLLSVATLFVLISFFGGNKIYLFAIPVLMFYSIVYALFVHLSVKSEYRHPGSYGLSMDNVLLSFFMTTLLALFLGYPLIAVMTIIGLGEFSGSGIITIFGIIYFFYFFRLSCDTYHGVDLDHLFGASFIPFVCFISVAHYVQGAMS